ncbi:hypothetical protein HYU92_06585 [Candidatus Curtissbacteria bacterium]|nr:hypothetical protein [Candidatus Curtissbacteria bacterium]
MFHEKILKTILATRPHLLTIKEHTSFGKIIEKVSSQKYDFIIVNKAAVKQMAAVLTLRLLGRKFFWIQNFSNPPASNFFARLLLNQSDRILVASKKEIFKLKKLGVDKPKIRIKNQS